MRRNSDSNADRDKATGKMSEEDYISGLDTGDDNGTERDSRCMAEGCSLCMDSRGRTTARDIKLKTNLISRLNRVEGQVRGIRGMIDKDIYCDDVLNQIAAAQAALNSISKLVLENHIRGCLVKKIRSGEDEIVDELLVTIGKLLK